ncbi:Ion-translocating oxidoreductase complex subunit B [Candidatus Lokiarchaeum ossiferum]|uniref:Ion-translocating oxidoreductase complex subunit B n=1 Tax=Candidatus Lokiarchaeum ossiferum TaxID=2951803 RepID=A0ABY6HRK4_9ARCH|nr:Ion-translocating oxidoreductase complex subunit B [Candidatus Lokiarchaeum sp. B-35]
MTEEKWKSINKCRDDRPEIQCWDNYWELPPASVSFPIKGSAGKTGAWRTFRPVIDQEQCIKCYFCFMYCPEGTIKVNDETKEVYVDYEYCKGCGVCANNCPKKCIDMKKESN